MLSKLTVIPFDIHNDNEPPELYQASPIREQAAKQRKRTDETNISDYHRWSVARRQHRIAAFDGPGYWLRRQGKTRQGFSQQATLFAVCCSQLSNATILWRHPFTHFLLVRCGSVRRALNAAARRSLCKGQRSYGIQWSAREVIAAAGFSRRV